MQCSYLLELGISRHEPLTEPKRTSCLSSMSTMKKYECYEKEITNEKISYHHCSDGVIVIIIRAVKNAL